MYLDSKWGTPALLAAASCTRNAAGETRSCHPLGCRPGACPYDIHTSHAGEACSSYNSTVVPAFIAGTHCPVRSRSEEHTSELQSLMRISYAVFCLKTKNNNKTNKQSRHAQTPA